MLQLNELSKIGFGCYRLSRSNPEHYASLRRAIERGCNLIDTAPTYSDGDSERLVGAFASAHSGRCPFIITKAGYVTGESRSLMTDLNQAGKATEDLVRKADGSLHSIHPEFLEESIHRSLRRLNRGWVDGFLLHNPEYYFDQVNDTPTRSGYYLRIKKAFECLETLVQQGVVRYYGISSNALPFGGEGERATNFFRILEVAASVSSNHHFRLIQFPFNLFENHARLALHDGISLIEAARSCDIVTLVNRPLNANSGNGFMRLATYDEKPGELDENRDERLLGEFVETIQERLDDIHAEDNAMDFTPVQVIAHGWKSFGSPDVVDQVFEHRLSPFLVTLYGDEMGNSVRKCVAELRQTATAYARRNLTRLAEAVREKMVHEGGVAAEDPRSLSQVACWRYLNEGVNHVLVGMRRTTYVDDLAPLF